MRDACKCSGLRIGKTIRRESHLTLGDMISVGDVEFELKDGRSKNGKNPSPKKTGKRDKQRPSKNMLSQSMPVIIPDEDQSFSVEKSVNKRPPSSAPIELNSSDIIE